tara:strand:+ start:1942 stop:2838 length:897 start_codon:yes stop_codon:yes gene_type:complete
MMHSFQFLLEAYPHLFPLLSLGIGALVGSFLNVCIYRIPAGQSVVTPGSHCACGKSIPLYHNIPIFSWCWLRGRAHCCQARFSIRYPLVELLTALLFAASAWTHPPTVALLGMVFIAFLICATFIDLDHMIIPDRFSMGGMLLALVASICVPELHAVEANIMLVARIHAGLESLMGALIGAGLVYWVAALAERLFGRPAMGEGDVKFVGFIGAFCGWQGAVFAFFGGALFGTVLLLPWLLFLKCKTPKARTESEAAPAVVGLQVPFGPFLALAGLTYFLGLNQYVDLYFQQVALNFGL